MKKNMLLIIGLVVMMMLGVTGTARSGAGDPLLIVKANSLPPGLVSMKPFKYMNTNSVWFVNADDQGSEQWYDDTIEYLRVWDVDTHQEWLDSRYSDEFQPFLRKLNIPSGEVMTMSGIDPKDRWTGGWKDGKFHWFYRPGFNLRVEVKYKGSTSNYKNVWVPVYSTVYLYRLDTWD